MNTEANPAPVARKKGKKRRREKDILNIAFENQIKDNYWYPSYVKYLAWALCVGIVLGCSVELTLNAMSFGEVKSLLWLFTVFITILIVTFVVQPIKVFLLTVFAAYIIKRPEPVMHKPLPEKLTENYFDRKKFNQVIKLRRRMAPFYLPLDNFSARKRKIEIRYYAEVKGLVGDIFSYILFMLIVYVVIYGNKPKLAVYSNQAMEALVVTADYSNTIPFSRIVTHEQFIVYINETLIPSLLVSEVPFKKKNSSGSGARIPMPDRAHTLESDFKLLGKPRLRQKRVKEGTCEIHPAVSNSRSKECAGDLNIWTEDTKDYTVGWDTIKLGRGKRSYSQPWHYRTAKENRAPSYSGRLHQFHSTDGGGYVLPLGKTASNAKTVVNFMYYFNWIDSRTRSVYIEFATYSAGSDLYNTVILNVEITAIGAYIPSYKIYTQQIKDFEMDVAIFIAFAAFICFIALREGVKMRRVSKVAYFTELWTVLDLIIIICGLLSCITMFLRTYHMMYLIQELDRKSNSEFVGFEYAAYYNQITEYLFALMVALGTIKCYRLLTFRITFRLWDEVFRHAWPLMLAFYTLLFVTILIFSIFFHGELKTIKENTRTVWGTMLELICHFARTTDIVDESFYNYVPTFFGVPIYVLFLFFTSYFIMTAFLTIMSVHIRAIRMQPVKGHYQVLQYILSLFWSNAEMASLKITPLPLAVNLVRRRGCDFVPPNCLDEVRLQGLKKETLQWLTGDDYSHITGLNVAYIVLSGNSDRVATDVYAIVNDAHSQVLISESKVLEMKDVADRAVEARNNEIKEEYNL